MNAAIVAGLLLLGSMGDEMGVVKTLFSERRDGRAAESALRQLLKADPSSREANYLLAGALYDWRRFAEARLPAEIAVAADPLDGQARLLMGKIYAEQRCLVKFLVADHTASSDSLSSAKVAMALSASLVDYLASSCKAPLGVGFAVSAGVMMIVGALARGFSVATPGRGFRLIATPLLSVAISLGAHDSALAQPRGVSESSLGMVSSAHPEATQAGVRVLEAGGNAFDAAVAVAATLGVVEPMNSGIGGYGTILTYSARDQRVRFLNSSGRIPAGVDSDAFRAPTPAFERNRRGAKAVSTPANVAAWAALSREYGSADWTSLFRDAIRLADEGFPISVKTAEVVRVAYDSFSPDTRRFYGFKGRPLAAGARLIQRDLAKSLAWIARDRERAISDGPLGAAIDKTMREGGGFLRASDLRASVAEWSDAISIDYRNARVYTAPPPANAFDFLVRLGLMAQFDVRALGHNSVPYLHRFAEVTKHAFAVRLRHAGDPEIAPPPLGLLLSQPYWVEQAHLLSLDRATSFRAPSPSGETSENTTHFVVADAAGNIVSATQTLGNLFGSRIMPAGTGIWLNNSLAYSTFEPKGNPMDAHPGRRKLSGDCPTIIFKGGRPWAALGTPGGHTIGQTAAQMAMNLIDFDMSISGALDAPRVSFIEPNQLAVEEGVPAGVRAELLALGHDVILRALGNAHGLTVEYSPEGRPHRFVGAADRRGEGAARGPARVAPRTDVKEGRTGHD